MFQLDLSNLESSNRELSAFDVMILARTADRDAHIPGKATTVPVAAFEDTPS